MYSTDSNMPNPSPTMTMNAIRSYQEYSHTVFRTTLRKNRYLKNSSRKAARIMSLYASRKSTYVF